MNQMFATPTKAGGRIVAESRPNIHEPPFEDRSASLRSLFMILYRRKAWIIVTALVFTITAALFAFSRPRDYVATVRVLIDPRGIQVVDRDVTPPAQTNDGSVAIVESQLRVMVSERVLSRVIDEQNLLSDPEFTASSNNPIQIVRSAINDMLGRAQPASDPRVKVLDALSSAVSAGRPERSFVVELSVKTRDGAKSARIANAIAAAYMSSEVGERAGVAHRAATSLIGRLDELREALRKSEDEAGQYRHDHDIVDSEGELVNEQQLTQLNTNLINAQARTSAARAALDQIRHSQDAGSNPDTLPEAVLSGTIRQLRSQYATARQREVAESARLLPGHPAMIRIAAEVRSLRDEITQELNRIALAAEADYERALANETALAAELEKQKRTTYATNDAKIRLRELERQVEANRVVYEAYLVRARELSEQVGVDTAAARVIAEAVPPLGPLGPGNGLIIALAAIFGVGLGGVLGIGRETLDPTIRDARQIEDAFSLRVLATVPIVAWDGKDALPAFVAHHPASPASGALYRAADLLEQSPCIGRPRTVLVTASDHGDGKTTVALNLALAAATGGARVLLIDGDAARRTLSKVRYGDPQTGLSSVLDRKIALHDALVADPSGLIEVLPAGRRTTHQITSRGTGEQMLRNLFADLDAVDLVVVDGGAATPDSGIGVFGDVADSIVLVARADITSESRLAASIRQMGAAWTRVSGAILVADRS